MRARRNSFVDLRLRSPSAAYLRISVLITALRCGGDQTISCSYMTGLSFGAVHDDAVVSVLGTSHARLGKIQLAPRAEFVLLMKATQLPLRNIEVLHHFIPDRFYTTD